MADCPQFPLLTFLALRVFKCFEGIENVVIPMRKKLVCILLLTALLVASSCVLISAGEDSDCSRIKVMGWNNPFGKEGGDEGIFLCFISGEDSD
jgi:hypothetical protein